MCQIEVFVELPAYTMNAKFMEHWINGNLLSWLLWLLETAFIKLSKRKFCNLSDCRSWFCTSIWFHRPYSLILILIYVDHLAHFHRDSTKLGVLNLLIYIYYLGHGGGMQFFSFHPSFFFLFFVFCIGICVFPSCSANCHVFYN